MTDFEQGLLLMVIGMSAVYVILLLVIAFGKGLILLVNRYAPTEVVAAKTVRKSAAAARGGDGAATAAIVSAVSVLTGGQGRVTKIETN
ncbi:MAG: OadG family protein [Tannerella sp.]|nr:OadG family protein [Tannerella sp.]